LDYLLNPDPVAIAKLSGALEGNEIFTFRSRAEGGVSKLSEDSRIKLLSRIISLSKPPFVDHELAALTSSSQLMEEARSVGCKIIGSSHNFHSMEDHSNLKSFVESSNKQGEFFAIKVVRKARNFADNARLLSLYEIASRISPAKLIAFCAGPFGILSRIACVSLGSPFTYVSLPNEKTAPGQLDAGTMRSLLQNW
jgi:3-dehydroquinate dehydratase type I